LHVWPSLAWRTAAAAFDQAAAQERAWHELRGAFALVTPEGELNDRPRAEAVVARVLPQWRGPDGAEVRRLLQRPEAFGFLGRLRARVRAVPLAADRGAALLRLEGLRRCPERLRDEGPAGAGAGGLALVSAVPWAAAGADGPEAAAAVRQAPRGCRRASSRVECLNSVLRMRQARHRRLRQGLLDLGRLYGDCRPFRTGRREARTPYELPGVQLPAAHWWDLLKMAPDRLRQRLSEKRLAA
jgi:hypothetical protein